MTADEHALKIAVAELKASLPANMTPEQEAEAIRRFAFDYAFKKTLGMTFAEMAAKDKVIAFTAPSEGLPLDV
jgi:hypothetical protein